MLNTRYSGSIPEELGELALLEKLDLAQNALLMSGEELGNKVFSQCSPGHPMYQEADHVDMFEKNLLSGLLFGVNVSPPVRGSSAEPV